MLVVLWFCLGDNLILTNACRTLGIRRIELEKIIPTDPERDENPSARSNHSLIYDDARDVMVLFGGFGDFDSNNTNPLLADTWEYARSIGGLSIPLLKTQVTPISLQAVSSVMVAENRRGRVNHLQIQSKSPMQTKMTANQFTRETDGQWETITHTITEPAQLQQLAMGYNQNITAQFESEKLDPDMPKQAINLDYMELRFLYDLDHDNTQIEPTCGDGVINPGSAKPATISIPKTAITARPTVPKNLPGAATAPSKQTPAKSATATPKLLVQQRLLV